MESLTIQSQGSFVAGGHTITAPSKFEFNDALGVAVQTRHSDHSYVEYQIPKNTNKYPLVFVIEQGSQHQYFKHH